MDCVRGRSLKVFTEHYQDWCRRKGYNFRARKAEEVYRKSSDFIFMFPKDGNTKMLIWQVVALLNAASETVELLRLEMDRTASANKLLRIYYGRIREYLASLSEPGDG